MCRNWNDYTMRGYQFAERPNGNNGYDYYAVRMIVQRRPDKGVNELAELGVLGKLEAVNAKTILSATLSAPQMRGTRVLSGRMVKTSINDLIVAVKGSYNKSGQYSGFDDTFSSGAYKAANASTPNAVRPVTEITPHLKYSLRTPSPATTRDYLLSLTDADLRTAGEKDAMARYKQLSDELAELELTRVRYMDAAGKERTSMRGCAFLVCDIVTYYRGILRRNMV